MALFDWIENLFRERNSQMAWGRIPSERVVGGGPQPAYVANDDYIVVRLGSMYLRDSRELWLKLSPLVHGTVGLRGLREPRGETAIIGPAQFGDLAVASADRSVVLNQRLAGPAVWRGGDLELAVGLFAVPKDQAAKALLGTLSQLSELGIIPGLQQGLDIGKIVKDGIEGLIGLNGSRPVLGVKVALSDTQSAGPGHFVGIAAPQAEVPFDQLWLKDGRLHSGTAARQLQAYEEHDHIVISVERGQLRQDWRGLPSLTPHEAAFNDVLKDTTGAADDLRARLNTAFRAFDGALFAEEGLTNPDKTRIRGEVIVSLQERLKRITDPLGAPAIETRSIGGRMRRQVTAIGFDFLDVGDLPLGTDMTALVNAGEAPF